MREIGMMGHAPAMVPGVVLILVLAALGRPC